MEMNDFYVTLKDLDISIFRFLNGGLQSPMMDTLMLLVNTVGGGVFILLLAAAIVFFGGKRNKVSGILIMAGFTVTYQVSHYLKELIARPRPFVALEGVNTLIRVEDFSFPSTHAAISFMVAYILSIYFRKYSFIAYAVALLVSFSRIYEGVHYPADVLGGAVLGIVIGYFIVKMAEMSGIDNGVRGEQPGPR